MIFRENGFVRIQVLRFYSFNTKHAHEKLLKVGCYQSGTCGSDGYFSLVKSRVFMAPPSDRTKKCAQNLYSKMSLVGSLGN